MGSNKCIKGENDLASQFPDLAAQANGWDPREVTIKSSKKLSWKCPKYDDHFWEATVYSRTPPQNSGCPICANKLLLKGFNDLATVKPEISKEADGWDPSEYLPNAGDRKLWKCSLGHTWESTIDARSKSGCPYCSNKKVLIGFNDLKTKFPEIAKEAYGWDPKTVVAGSSKKKKWRCNKNHPYWEAVVNSRTGSQKAGCPYCAGKLPIQGETDLKTKFPNIAKEAHDWDPSLVLPFSHIYRKWRCSKGHIYSESPAHRCQMNVGCSICSGNEILIGFNDLRTTHPDVASQAIGWDPTTVTAGSNLKKKWQCKNGHPSWEAAICDRTRFDATGCPYCAEYGFDRKKEAWMYLMSRPGEQQFGITNNLKKRIQTHALSNWKLLDHKGPFSGELVYELESELKKWLRKKIGTISGTTENWNVSKLEVLNLVDLKEKSKIKNDLF